MKIKSIVRLRIYIIEIWIMRRRIHEPPIFGEGRSARNIPKIGKYERRNLVGKDRRVAAMPATALE